jgi:hypothetical protein
VHLPHEGLLRMIGCGKDVVGALVALKALGAEGPIPCRWSRRRARFY